MYPQKYSFSLKKNLSIYLSIYTQFWVKYGHWVTFLNYIF